MTFEKRWKSGKCCFSLNCTERKILVVKLVKNRYFFGSFYFTQFLQLYSFNNSWPRKSFMDEICCKMRSYVIIAKKPRKTLLTFKFHEIRQCVVAILFRKLKKNKSCIKFVIDFILFTICKKLSFVKMHWWEAIQNWETPKIWLILFNLRWTFVWCNRYLWTWENDSWVKFVENVISCKIGYSFLMMKSNGKK